MKSVRRSLILVFVLFSGTWLLSACAPTVQTAQTAPAVYDAPSSAVFTAVLETIAADPGVAPYNPGGVNGYRRGASTPWLVTVSDREAGLIVAEARSRAAGFVGSDAPPDVHRINVEVTPLSVGPPRTRVAARGTPFTRAFLERLEETLKTRFVPGYV